MPGLPHYLNNRASTKNYEPLYQNLFEVSIIPPTTVAGGELLLEHVRSVSGLDTDRGSDAVDQAYKHAKRKYASGVPTDTTVEVTLNFSLNLNDNNEMYVYKTLRDWQRKIHNPLTGEQGLKKDYVGTMVVVMHNRAGDIFWQRTLYSVFPVGDMPSLELSYDDGAVLSLDGMRFSADYWTENIV